MPRLSFGAFLAPHHPIGIGSPEMLLAAAGERTKRIKLATAVVSLPRHHPHNVAQRMVQLDSMTGGRANFGSGPGALPSDAHTLGIDPMLRSYRPGTAGEYETQAELYPAQSQAVRAPAVAAKVAPLGILQAYATPERQAAEVREEFRRVTEMVKKASLTK